MDFLLFVLIAPLAVFVPFFAMAVVFAAVGMAVTWVREVFGRK